MVAFGFTILIVVSASGDCNVAGSASCSDMYQETGAGDLYLLQTSLTMGTKEARESLLKDVTDSPDAELPEIAMPRAMRLPEAQLPQPADANDKLADASAKLAAASARAANFFSLVDDPEEPAESLEDADWQTVTSETNISTQPASTSEDSENTTETKSANESVNQSANESVTTAAEATGVQANAEGDLEIFLVALGTNTVIILIAVLFFMCVKPYFPEVYEYRIIQKTAPVVPVAAGPFNWVRRSMGVTMDQVQDSTGLDAAGLLEFTHLGMNILGILTIPLLCFEGPMNLVFGGNAAGKDYLSYLSFGNVQDESWLYWVHCVLVWVVVFTVQVSIYRAMESFVKQRYRWLQELPPPRSHTLLIEDIPAEYRSEAVLKAYFEDIFGRGKVHSVYFVLRDPALLAAVRRKENAELALQKARAQRAANPALATDMRALELELTNAQNDVRNERRNLTAMARRTGGVNTGTAFVRFQQKSDVELAARAQYGEDISEWCVSAPPAPEAIEWEALKAGSEAKVIMKIIGYLLVGVLYMGYLPAVIWISKIATSVDVGPLQPLWGAFAPTLGLQIMVAFLPTFLLLIFHFFFMFPDTTYSQQELQNWYFVFQVVFVILVTAIGPSLADFMKAIAENPLDVPLIFGKTMPLATHFYMNFIVLQWVSHFTNLTRNVNLIKYIIFGNMSGWDKAKELSEPEDQDYYGMGSRSARFTINLCIGIVYGTLSPPITVLTFINFAVCRLVYGYLMCFAESKKPDSGGAFFVHQLKHVFWGNAIYCMTMTGVLLGRAETSGPGIIAAISLPYVLWSRVRFNTKYEWERLPLHQAIKLVEQTPRGTPATGFFGTLEEKIRQEEQAVTQGVTHLLHLSTEDDAAYEQPTMHPDPNDRAARRSKPESSDPRNPPQGGQPYGAALLASCCSIAPPSTSSA